MFKKYTDNKNQQIVIALLKAFGIKKVIASPGGTNPALVASFQYDGSFELYSCVDERSAAYMACGLCEESNEPVVICCTGATASRNYMPGLTEAFYRKLPIITLTCSRPIEAIGQLIPQVTDRTSYPNDIFVDGAQLVPVRTKQDEQQCSYVVNRVLLSSTHHGGGPVHLNIVSVSQSCDTDTLPVIRKIDRYMSYDQLPNIGKGKIAIFVGSHKEMTARETIAIEQFCQLYNGVVLCDHTSSYHGEYRIDYSLIGTQVLHSFDYLQVDLLIHIGEISGDYQTPKCINANKIWRVSEDGQLRKTFGHIEAVFEMPESLFFEHYNNLIEEKSSCSYFKELNTAYENLNKQIPELEFSNIWLAKELSAKMPKNSCIHFAILNSLRSWNFFRIDPSIKTMCNVGGFGIDGCTSSLVGASLANKNKLYYLVTGDLAFFYDLNAIGNRHIGPNIRILLVNTGNGAEFLHFQSPEYEVGVKPYIAAEGHFGNKSHKFVKAMVESLGFDYYAVNNKEEFLKISSTFTDEKIGKAPMLVEAFIDAEKQSDAWESLSKLAEGTMSEKAVSVMDNMKHSGFGKIVKRIIK